MRHWSELIIVLFLFSLLLQGCSGREEAWEELLRPMESGEYREQELDAQRVEEIRKGIEKYRDIVEEKVEATAQIGIYYKMLAVQYFRAGMYQKAYEYLQEAISIHTENPVLFCLSAGCAARIGKSKVEEDERLEWLDRAEFLYQRALELGPNYTEALYGFSVLLIYELNRPEEAEPLLKRLLELESKHVDGMFLLGNIYYRLGRLEEALEVYDRIIQTTGVREKKRQAEANKERIEEELYGAR